MLVVRNIDEYKRAKKLRWFGIDREQKIEAGWQAWKNREMTIDIKEPGFKFHMNDINAAIGLVMLKHSDEILEYRKKLSSIYSQKLKACHTIAGGSFWLYGVLIKNRDRIAHNLMHKGIDVNMVHLRNDIYSAFGGKRQNLANMNFIEDSYLYLPLNTFITEKQVERTIKEFNDLVNS